MQQAENLYNRAVWIPEGVTPPVGQPFLINDDPRRGVRVIGIREPNKREVTVYTVYKIEDDIIRDQAKMRREAYDGLSSARKDASDLRPVALIPKGLAQVLYSKDGDGFSEPLAPNDPERDKRLNSFANDLDYRDLRLSTGKV